MTMRRNVRNSILKAMDIIYEHLDSMMETMSTEEMKETLFIEFTEYNNGVRENLFKVVKKKMEPDE